MRFLFFFFLFPITISAQNWSQYVNPFIGTGGHGHTFPGATVPHGMVQLSPDTRIDGSWGGCSGYHYSDDFIYGFSHTHLNGTGVSDYGDIMLMPTMGKANFNPKNYGSHFSHKNEKATAGYYEVHLDKPAIDVRLTTSERVGFHEYTFNQTGEANIILDLNHRDELLKGEVFQLTNRIFFVKRHSKAWAQNQYMFARIEFDRDMAITDKRFNGNQTETTIFGTQLALSFGTNVQKGETLKIKVALSFTGYEGATLNRYEIPDWDFEKVKSAAEQKWNDALSVIEAYDADKEKLTVFYTALYHTMIQPNIFEDLDGKYRGRDNKLHSADDFDYYTVFSLWDTFRATHPLYTLIDKKRTVDYINTFIAQYEQGGRLPVWEFASNETDCMIGYHSVSVIADAMMKGINGFDYEKAYEAAKHSAMLNHLGLEAYKNLGFIRIDDEHESVSKTLEYAYDDWCIAMMAQKLGKTEDYNYFSQRSQAWKNLFNPENQFIQPRLNGGWLPNFDPREVNNYYTEGNGWQYHFFVPHDISEFISKHGGKENFEQKLDALFTQPTQTTGRTQVDITGLIGQYAHGNEPSHHIAYLYNYVDKPEKTREKVHYILDEFYKNAPDGLIGNEDCGQMSAWYVLSAMGIYSVTPGLPQWETTEPFFDKFIIHLEDGTTREITKESSPEYLRKLGFEDIEFPSYSFMLRPDVPIISPVRKVFDEEMQIEITSKSDAYYSVNDDKFKKYENPFKIKENSIIKAYSTLGRYTSKTITAEYKKRPNNYTIDIQSQYNPQYTAGGDLGLLDGVLGTTNWRKGDWQGYQDQDFVAVIDLQEYKTLEELSIRLLQDTRSWIVYPKKVEFYGGISMDDMRLLGTVNNKKPANDYEVQIQRMTLRFLPENFRYIMVIAQNYGTLPEWHQGAGFEAFIFVDEVILKEVE